MNKGWIKLYRKITENPMYFSEPFTRMQAWIDMIIMANHNEKYFYVRGNKVDIKRGQIGMSQDSLSKRWKWSRGKVIRFLKQLETDMMIVQQKNNITTLISITNYNQYQLSDTTDSTTDDTTDGQQTVQQTDTNKNIKNIKNEKNINIAFDEFWNLYDKKRGDKEKLKNKWEKLTDNERDEIMNYIPLYIQSQPEKKYRKDPSTFLNNKSWKDELISNTNNSNYQNNGNKQSKKSGYRGGIAIIEKDIDYSNDQI